MGTHAQKHEVWLISLENSGFEEMQVFSGLHESAGFTVIGQAHLFFGGGGGGWGNVGSVLAFRFIKP